MTIPLPDRLALLRRQYLLRTEGAHMLALLSCILFVLAAFGVSNDEVNIAYVAAALLALHFVVDYPVRRP